MILIKNMSNVFFLYSLKKSFKAFLLVLQKQKYRKIYLMHQPSCFGSPKQSHPVSYLGKTGKQIFMKRYQTFFVYVKAIHTKH